MTFNLFRRRASRSPIDQPRANETTPVTETNAAEPATALQDLLPHELRLVAGGDDAPKGGWCPPVTTTTTTSH